MIQGNNFHNLTSHILDPGGNFDPTQFAKVGFLLNRVEPPAEDQHLPLWTLLRNALPGNEPQISRNEAHFQAAGLRNTNRISPDVFAVDRCHNRPR